MIRTELPIPRAFRALLDAFRHHGIGSNAITFALTWLAAARMVLTGNVPGASSLDDLGTEAGWSAVERAGLPLHGVDRWLGADSKSGGSLLVVGKNAVKELVGDLGTQPWDVLPTLSSSILASREAEGMVSAEVAELMLDMLGEPEQDVWVPFDRWGTLTVRALRRGWRVKSASMLGQVDSALPLLLAVEYGQLNGPRLETEVERDREGRPLTRAAFVLACPPFGMPVHESRLAQWDSSDGEATDRFVRSETWAVRELVNRASKKAVFLVPPGVLFTRGQEQRLREYLLHRGGECNELHSVVALPSGAVSGTGLGTAVMVLTPDRGNDDILMVDLGLSKRSLSNLDELVRTHRLVALGQAEDPERACRVIRDDIMRNEVSFAPSRYLRKSVEVGPNAVQLEALCEVVRAPILARDEKVVELLELGIPELGGWTCVGHGLEKKARVKCRRDLPTLERGDVVLSIKGSIGKAGVVGEVEPDAVVVSQSCVALRIAPSQRDKVSAEFLLMYLRSEAGQAQLESLQAGATVQHVSPQSLLTSFLVPMPTADEREAVEADYRSLCQLEQDVERIQKQMTEIAKSRWAL